jgi:hypothetical protein
MTRIQLFVLAGVLAMGSAGSLLFGVSMLAKDIGSYVSQQFSQYSRDADSTRYVCSGRPSDVADALEDYQDSEARTANGGTEYLRYDDNMVIVGPDGKRPCTVRVEDIDAGYSHGSYLFLGPGFSPGSPSGGAGGSPGGPDGTK